MTSRVNVRFVLVVLLALGIETVNDSLLMPPIDVGYGLGTPWYIQLTGTEWVVLHLPWLMLPNIDMPIIFTGGFIDTALLLALGLFCISKVRELLKRRYRRM